MSQSEQPDHDAKLCNVAESCPGATGDGQAPSFQAHSAYEAPTARPATDAAARPRGRFWAEVWATGIPARKAERLARLEAEEAALQSVGLDAMLAGGMPGSGGPLPDGLGDPFRMLEGLGPAGHSAERGLPAPEGTFATRAKFEAQEVLAEAREHVAELEADVESKHAAIDGLEREIFRVEQHTAAAKLRYQEVAAQSAASENVMNELEATLALREAEVRDLCSAAELLEVDAVASSERERERGYLAEESARLDAELTEARKQLELVEAKCTEIQLRHQACEAEGQDLQGRLAALRETFADVGVDVVAMEGPDGFDTLSLTLAMCRAIMP